MEFSEEAVVEKSSLSYKDLLLDYVEKVFVRSPNPSRASDPLKNIAISLKKFKEKQISTQADLEAIDILKAKSEFLEKLVSLLKELIHSIKFDRENFKTIVAVIFSLIAMFKIYLQGGGEATARQQEIFSDIKTFFGLEGRKRSLAPPKTQRIAFYSYQDPSQGLIPVTLQIFSENLEKFNKEYAIQLDLGEAGFALIMACLKKLMMNFFLIESLLHAEADEKSVFKESKSDLTLVARKLEVFEVCALFEYLKGNLVLEIETGEEAQGQAGKSASRSSNRKRGSARGGSPLKRKPIFAATTSFASSTIYSGVPAFPSKQEQQERRFFSEKPRSLSESNLDLPSIGLKEPRAALHTSWSSDAVLSRRNSPEKKAQEDLDLFFELKEQKTGELISQDKKSSNTQAGSMVQDSSEVESDQAARKAPVAHKSSRHKRSCSWKNLTSLLRKTVHNTEPEEVEVTVPAAGSSADLILP